MRSLVLRFECHSSQFQLIETSFNHDLLGKPLHSIRGKVAGAYPDAGTFQWTKAVQALTLLIIRAKLENSQTLAGVKEETLERARTPELVGYRGSFAASLDAAMSKAPCWLVEMFGSDSRGICLVERLLTRTNSGLRRPGPLAISLNRKFLSIQEIQIEDFSGKALSRGNLENISFQFPEQDVLLDSVTVGSRANRSDVVLALRAA